MSTTATRLKTDALCWTMTVEQLRQNEDIKEFYLGLILVGERKSCRDIKRYKRRKRWLGWWKINFSESQLLNFTIS
ncbi:MAG TPA: hypothetical protein G4N96_07765 [Chloroflexi bacterium]|nr:hypothetical protein [Chloroflexota bacterium]